MSKTKKDIRNNKEFNSSSSCTSSSLSSDEEVDARDLKPIRDYLSDRKELAHQLFKCVKPEKIRMMLPQILKQVDLSEMEQWCVSELNGMSKSRILSILDDKPMLESSDTSESDDTGPSLEIISDSEEWFTDDDVSKKEDDGKRGKGKAKGKAQMNKTNDLDKNNLKTKCNIKNENNDKNKDVKIKKEDDKDKEKEGESLLDLLELEMRARAIRALIRREEDVIPSSNLPQTTDEAVENNTKILQDNAKAKENCRKKLEKIINAKQGNIGEDEDVVLVVQPTPVVELLSSDSDGENHGGTRINKKLENERITETEKSSNSQKERKKTQEITGTHSNANTVSKTDLNIRSETRTLMPERNVDIRNNTLSISISADNIAEKRKKSKKRSHTKSQLTPANEDSPKLKQINTIETIEQSNDIKDKNTNEQSRINPASDKKTITTEEKNNTKEEIVQKSRIEKERSADLDEVIDLDDYCDVMDMENCDDEKSQDKIIAPSQQNKQSVSPATSNTQTTDPGTSETWASRYYQTDDVQNVIKESKIQSEIRKRLRERQRLSKLNKSPNINLSSQSPANRTTNAVSEQTPTGSVEEYLALKRAVNSDVNAGNDSSNNNTTTVQDNSTIINSNSDVKKNEVQDENISQECTHDIDDTTKPNNLPYCPSVVTDTVEAIDEVTKTDVQP